MTPKQAPRELNGAATSQSSPAGPDRNICKHFTFRREAEGAKPAFRLACDRFFPLPEGEQSIVRGQSNSLRSTYPS